MTLKGDSLKYGLSQINEKTNILIHKWPIDMSKQLNRGNTSEQYGNMEICLTLPVNYKIQIKTTG